MRSSENAVRLELRISRVYGADEPLKAQRMPVKHALDSLSISHQRCRITCGLRSKRARPT
jgi:hypothetical protein